MQLRKQAGFTLIELIMVIAILGILAAFALPKFADMGTEARTATINGVAASMRSASGIAHSAWLAAGSPAAGGITLEGSAYTLVSGYPDSMDILDMAQVVGDSLTLTPGANAAATEATASLQTDCTATYTEGGSVAVVTTGC